MNFLLQKLTLFCFVLSTLFLSVSVDEASAGFGITPPYVKNTSLTRNSVYEQQILLVRSDTSVAQKAEIVVDAPDIEDWIVIAEGSEIKIPQGVQKVPMTVKITVPGDAPFDEYKGSIRIRTLPDDDQVAPGAVSISLGALVDIELSVIDKQIKDFRVRRISAPDLNEGSKFAWLFFPGKIRFSMMIENTGNVNVAPSRVEFRIYDRSGKALLEETENIGRIKKIKPYVTETVVAEIPTRLPAGGYIARYTIYNGDEVKQEGDLSLNILPEGTLQMAGFGFFGLSLSHKVSVLLPIFSLIIAGIYVWHYRRKMKDVSR
ncbi:MAG: hypothetical protein H6782_04755 [Candidatus Nomurabacteria bacterium]|nr:MAG: hypothetical protein H6782_04755 [Candidatus Nomurabacteria bacterium]